MCGITGFFPGTLDSQSTLEAMLSRIAHRGPDQRGFHHSPAFAAGHHRLTIIDPTGGQQPMITDNGSVLVFNGEIYNFKALSSELELPGARDDYRSDTEVLFTLLNQKNIVEVLNMLDGMFAFAYYESISDTLYLARDRAGEKPLFYLDTPKGLYFASEPGCFFELDETLAPELDVQQCQLYLSLEYLPGTLTGLKQVKSLMPGHYCRIQKPLDQTEQRRYWPEQTPSNHIGSSTSNSIRRLTIDEKLTHLNSLLTKAVSDQLYADVPVGVFLSGGIDSSLIAAYCREIHSNIQAFTVSMPFKDYDESCYAQQVATHLGIALHTVELTEHDLNWAIDTLDEKLDQPFADYSLIPTLLLCRAASRHVRVALGGDGADELFAGYPNFKVQTYAPSMQHIPSPLGGLLRQMLKPWLAQTGYMNLPFKLQQLSYGFGHSPALQSFHWMSALSEQEVRSASRFQYDMDTLLYSVLAELGVTPHSHFTSQDLLDVFFRTYLPGDILTKVDRASMYVSMEVRSPFLSRAIIEFAQSLSMHDKLNNGQSKFLLKRLADRYLPKEIVGRNKHGFAMPLAHLMRGQLRDRFEEQFEARDNPALEWLDRKYVMTIWQQHLAGSHNHAKKLWVLYRLFVMGNHINKGRPQ